MDAFLIFITVFITLISSACTAILVPLRQRRWLAKGIPMLVLNILGYALTVFIWIIVPVLYSRFGLETDILFVIPLGIAVLYVVAVVVTEFVCGSLSRKNQPKEAQHEEPQPETELVEENVEEPIVETQPEEQVEAEPVEEQPIEEQAVAEVQPEEEPVKEEPIIEQPEQEQPAEENTDKE